MSRINGIRLCALLIFVLMIMLPVCAEEVQDIIDTSELTPQQINYKTCEVFSGSFIKETSVSASEYFPMTYNVKAEQSDAKFVEYMVKRGDTVKAGDVLARFYITGSDVAFTRMEMTLERLEEETERGIADREEAIRIKRAEISAMSKGYEQERAMLTLRKMETELEQYCFRQQYSIDQQREAFEEEKARREDNLLIAPIDGVITELAYKKADDAVTKGETLAVIYSEEIQLLRAKNERGELRYNMPVKIVMGNNKNQVTLTGRIVAADDAIPEKERTGYVFVALDPYDTEEIKIRSPKVVAETMRLDDVLLMERGAATLEAGKYYVTKLKDDMVQKRFIEFGLTNTEYVWALTGVEEGETLVLD